MLDFDFCHRFSQNAPPSPPAHFCFVSRNWHLHSYGLAHFKPLLLLALLLLLVLLVVLVVVVLLPFSPLRGLVGDKMASSTTPDHEVDVSIDFESYIDLLNSDTVSI